MSLNAKILAFTLIFQWKVCIKIIVYCLKGPLTI